MNLQEYIETLNKLVTDNPDLATVEVWTACDEEGNGFSPVGFAPSIHFIPLDCLSGNYSDICLSEDSIEEHMQDYECLYPEDFDSTTLYQEALKTYKENKVKKIVLLN